MGESEKNVRRDFSMGIGIALGLIAGMVITIIAIPLLGISTCGLLASRSDKVSEENQEIKDGERQKIKDDERQEIKDKEASSQAEAEKAYISRIEPRNINVETILGRKYVSGELKNLGKRSLKEVEITIYYLDKDDKPVTEEKHYPVSVSSRDGSEKGLLKPNYTDTFTYELTSKTSDWAGKIKVKISGVKFYDQNPVNTVPKQR